MSKILPKSMLSQSSQNFKSNQSRDENTETDVMFASLFGGASGESTSEEPLIGKSSMAIMMSPDSCDKDASGDEDAFDEQPNDDLMALIASVQGGRSLGQKIAGHQRDVLNDELVSEQAKTLPDDANPDALALGTSGALFSETQGGSIGMRGAMVSGLANMAFEDGVGLKGRPGDTSIRYNLAPANIGGISVPGQNKTSRELIGPQPADQSGAKIVGNLTTDMETSQTKNMDSHIADLRALRAANLEQKNADIDREAAKGDLGELNAKLGKNDLNGAGLKQIMASAANQKLGFQMASRGERGRAGNDLTRLAAASSATLDNTPLISGTAANGSSTGHSGGQTGQQGGSQAGAQSGGGLLSSLNNLQILDTAKDNWTEMLLQRVKNGLSGGKDQLDFQLNPRNLGKMRITLVMQNDRTNIQIQTETLAAASMLGDSEARLAQMLEASGLRLGNLNSGQFQGFGGAGSDQQANQQSQNKTGSLNKPDNGHGEGEVVAEVVAAESDNLINIQA
jgi:flagellar hook-length control protein FliK